MNAKDNNQIILDLPALNSILERLEAIEQKLDDIASVIEEQQFIKPPIAGKKMMTLKELSETYGFSLWSLRYKASKRQIPLTKIGRRIYVNIEDFEKWLEEKKIEVFRY